MTYDEIMNRTYKIGSVSDYKDIEIKFWGNCYLTENQWAFVELLKEGSPKRRKRKWAEVPQ